MRVAFSKPLYVARMRNAPPSANHGILQASLAAAQHPAGDLTHFSLSHPSTCSAKLLSLVSTSIKAIVIVSGNRGQPRISSHCQKQRPWRCPTNKAIEKRSCIRGFFKKNSLAPEDSIFTSQCGPLVLEKCFLVPGKHQIFMIVTSKGLWKDTSGMI